MTTLRPIKSGEQILNYYGPLPTSDLLRRYGYTTAKHARYDVAELTWASIKTIIDSHLPSKTPTNPTPSPSSLEEDDQEEEAFILERTSPDPDETGTLPGPAHFLSFPEELENQALARITALLPPSQDKPTRKRAARRVFAAVMVEGIRARLAEYATSADEDEALLGDLRRERRGGKGRLEMAVEVRLGEKKVLGEALAFAEELVRKAEAEAEAGERRGAETGDGARVKRQKTSR